MYPQLKEFIDQLNTDSITSDRKEVLLPLIDYLNAKRMRDEEINLLFVCTHNSRRSHFSQIWAQVAAHYYGIPIKSFSAGVEVTAMNERVAAELRSEGFIVNDPGGENPHYSISYDDAAEPMVSWSKLYDDSSIPGAGFAAIMTCSDADENCPFIPGAEQRLPIRYKDPKAFDGTSQEKVKYRECSVIIATEMFYIFSQVK